jgi:hypothetical protein
MPLAIWFWIVMFVWLLFGFWGDYVAGQPYPYRRAGFHFITFVLLLILGWQVFGSAVK